VKDPSLDLGIGRVRDGDALLVSGPIGDHGIAVLLAREQFGLRGDLMSDAASVLPIARELVKLPGLRFMRDPTRGGLATVAHEIVQGGGLGVVLEEARVPVRDSVQSVCEMLGYDPYFLACEGRIVAVVAQDDADRALAAMRSLPSGRDAAIIGRVQQQPVRVLLETTIGGERVVEELEDDPLPRIC
jgi:hydrogenase expression/formation protein HypE